MTPLTMHISRCIAKICQAIIITVVLISVNLSVTYANENSNTNNRHQVNDLDYGVSLFDFYQENYFTSITDLLVAQKKQSIKQNNDESKLLLGSLYILYGLRDEASEIFNALLNNTSNAGTIDQAWFYLAKVYYQNGQFDKAKSALQNIKNNLPANRFSESIYLLANIYLKNEQLDDAISLLKIYSSDSTWHAYSKFNIGSALIFKNRLDEAKPYLEQVSNLDAHNQEQNALRDKANLALAYVSLKLNQAEQAISYFNKVRLNGALSSRALLGIGWAWNSLSMHKKSLVPWFELKNYNALEASVQESLIVIPYALEKINKPELALQHYNNAIKNYTRQSESLNKILSSINNGQFIESLMPANLQHESYLENLYSKNRQALSSPYFYQLFSSNEFQKQLRELQDLIYLKQILKRWDDNLPTLNFMLEEREENYQEKLREFENKKHSVFVQPLLDKRKKLAESLENIDALSLTSLQEKNDLGSLSSINNKINNISNSHDVSELEEKSNRLYGLLYWDITTDYQARLWQAQKSLKELDKDIEINNRLQQSLTESINNVPKGFSGYSQRINLQQNKIKKLIISIDKTLIESKLKINAMAIASVNEHKTRINNYQLRARYSLARLHDQQAKTSSRLDD